MGLELVAARVLAPFLGTSIYVWGSVITVVMMALSLGYWVGGQFADRWGAGRVLAPVIAAAGLSTCAAPLLASRILPIVASWGPRMGALAAAAFIYFVPALFLAMVSPLGVRLAAHRGIERIGRSTGSLYAISTAGSIVGTLATSFWLIPVLSLEPLIVWTGAALVGVSFAALGIRERGVVAETWESDRGKRSGQVGLGTIATTVITAILAVAIGTITLWQAAPIGGTNEYGETVLFSQDTQYHRITVTEDETTRHLRFDESNQSAVDLEEPYESHIRYPDYFHLALAAQPDAKRVLLLGLGGASTTARFWRDYPELSIDSVEIDPVVVDVAERFFVLPQDERSRVFVEDARRFVQSGNEPYDIVIIDAYFADALPFHLTTQEFLEETDIRLASGGVVAYNVISSLEGDGSELFRSMYRTARTVWNDVYVFGVEYDADVTRGGSGWAAQRRRNIVVLATDGFADESGTGGDVEGALLSQVRTRVDGRVSVEGFESMGADMYRSVVPMADVPILTDSHAPTDALIEVQ